MNFISSCFLSLMSVCRFDGVLSFIIPLNVNLRNVLKIVLVSVAILMMLCVPFNGIHVLGNWRRMFEV